MFDTSVQGKAVYKALLMSKTQGRMRFSTGVEVGQSEGFELSVSDFIIPAEFGMLWDQDGQVLGYIFATHEGHYLESRAFTDISDKIDMLRALILRDPLRLGE